MNYKNIIKNFKPEFGNIKHIRANRDIKEITNLERVKNKTKGIISKIEFLKNKIIFNITK